MSNEYGAIPLSTANAVGASLKKKMGSLTGFAPVDWAETINKLGNKLPERTVSGAVCTFSDGADDVPMPSVTSDITGYQEGTGDPSPSNVRPLHAYNSANLTHNGKNELITSLDIIKSLNTAGVWDNNVYVQSGVTFTVNTNNGLVTGITVDGLASDSVTFRINEYKLKSGTFKKLNGTPVNGGDESIKLGYQGFGYVRTAGGDMSIARTSSQSDWNNWIYIAVANGYRVNDLTFTPMVRDVSETDNTFQPYFSNTITFQFGQSIYQGEIDWTNGIVTVTHGYIASYDGETINEPWISSIDKYVAGNSPSTGAQVVYPLTTPTTIQLTSEEVRSFLGMNNLWANTGDSEVTYFAQPSGGVTPVFTEEVICDNSSASSTLTFTEDWHDYDFLQFKLTNSSSGIITYITTTPDILDEIFARSSSKVLFNEFSNDQYALYTKSSDLSWSRSGTRNVNVTEVKGLTATNCTVSTKWIYKRGVITASNVTITAPKYFEAYDEIYMASCDGDSDDTMPCILPVRAGCAGYNFYGNNGRNCVRLAGNTATDTYGKDETKNIFAMMGINYEEV